MPLEVRPGTAGSSKPLLPGSNISLVFLLLLVCFNWFLSGSFPVKLIVCFIKTLRMH